MRGGLELREKGLRKEVHTHTHAHTYTNMAGSPASGGNVVGAQAMQAHAVSASTLPGLPRTGGERSETVSVSVEHAQTSSGTCWQASPDGVSKETRVRGRLCRVLRLCGGMRTHRLAASRAAQRPLCPCFSGDRPRLVAVARSRRRHGGPCPPAACRLSLSLALGGGTAGHALQRGAVELVRAAHEEGLTEGLRTNLGCG